MVKPGLVHWLVGLSLGGLCGVYLAQNYQLPELSDLFNRISNVAISYQKPSSEKTQSLEDSNKPTNK